MATKQFCDKCGKGIDSTSNLKLTVNAEELVVLEDKTSDQQGWEREDFDICKGCWSILRDVIKGELDCHRPKEKVEHFGPT